MTLNERVKVMDFGSTLTGWQLLAVYLVAGTILLLSLWGLVKLVRWAKGMPAAAYFILALFPLISLFPIPPAEIKKLQRVKQVQVKHKQESGDSPDNEKQT